MKTVFIAGATGYLGRYLVSHFAQAGWQVKALVRDANRAADLGAHQLVVAEATQPETLSGHFDQVDLVVSSLGITRQKDGLDYWDVDYQANLNLLEAALAAGVPHFAYVHVIGAQRMLQVPMVAAKQAFVERLQAASITSTVIAPSGYFSDMADFLNMAKSGRVWLFADGELKLNPIHGDDLAQAIVEACTAQRAWLDIGGPEVLTQNQLAQLAFTAMQRPARVTHLPDWIRRLLLKVLPLAPRSISGPARFFLTAMAEDMVGERYGRHRLLDHFKAQLDRQD
ncbi:SDR family oxidoreductase [Saccharospirillum sp. HFRX-1]|uniref:SDR family oxidoreductase n=1 Tax=unclassified Saccharospirillum TaxID=2633430 RepID=UPI0037122699